MFRTILVHADGSKDASARLSFAINLAKDFDATLLGIAAAQPFIPAEIYGAFATGITDPDYIDYDRKRLTADFAKQAQSFREQTEKAGLEATWRAEFAPTSDSLVRAAVAADLVVIGQGREPALPDMQTAVAGEVALRTGRPVLVVPDGLSTAKLGNILVAWKNSGEAQRAIADAIPFMKRASRVTIVSVQSDKAEGDGRAADALGFLVRHGIAAKSEVIDAKGGNPGTVILDHARSTKADIIVSGAYGHSRWREWAFGGVTRELLLNAQVPCLFSH